MKKILLRVLIVVSAPIWIPLAIADIILWLVVCGLFWLVGGVAYYIATGEDITQTKYNIFGI